MEMNSAIVTVLAIALLLVGGFVGALGFPTENEIIKEVVVEKTVEVPGLEVDNGNLDVVLQHIYDNEGSAEYLTEDLDDDEISSIVSRIEFINSIKSEAVSFIKSDLFDELDKFDVIYNNGTTNLTIALDEDEMKRLKIDDRDYELIVNVEDFEDGEAIVTVTGTFEQDLNSTSIKYSFVADVEIDEAEADDFGVITVNKSA